MRRSVQEASIISVILYLLSWVVADTRSSLNCPISFFMPKVFQNSVKAAAIEVMPKQ